MDVSINNVGRSQIKYEGITVDGKEGKNLGPILQGANVNIITASDFQKLLAELQTKIEEKNKRSALGALSNALERLNGIATGLEESQEKALLEIEIETKKLEELVKAYTKTEEERKKELETKTELVEQRNALEVKIQDLDNQIKEAQAAEVVDEKKINELKAAKSKAEKDLSDTNGKIKDVENRIAKLDKALKDNENEQNEVKAAIETASGKLDGTGWAILNQALRLTANQVVSQANGLLKEKLEEEETTSMQDIVGIFTEMLDKKTEEMRDEIVQKQQKNV